MITLVSEAIDAAADVIEAEGWTQGAYHRISHVDGDGVVHYQHCIVGGVRSVLNYNGRREETRLYEATIVALGSAIDMKVKEPGDRIIRWNDVRNRKRQQVLDFMRAQAKAARMREEAMAG